MESDCTKLEEEPLGPLSRAREFEALLEERIGGTEQDAPTILGAIATMLDEAVLRNESQHVDEEAGPSGRQSVFHGINPPLISLHRYLERIYKYVGCSPACYVLATVYMDRVAQAEQTLHICSRSVHRLLITSVLLAAKFLDDKFFNNAYYAKVGGISTDEINELEVETLQRIDWRLYVSPDDFEHTLEFLVPLQSQAAKLAKPVTDKEVSSLRETFSEELHVQPATGSASCSSESPVRSAQMSPEPGGNSPALGPGTPPVSTAPSREQESLPSKRRRSSVKPPFELKQVPTRCLRVQRSVAMAAPQFKVHGPSPVPRSRGRSIPARHPFRGIELAALGGLSSPAGSSKDAPKPLSAPLNASAAGPDAADTPASADGCGEDVPGASVQVSAGHVDPQPRFQPPVSTTLERLDGHRSSRFLCPRSEEAAAPSESCEAARHAPGEAVTARDCDYAPQEATACPPSSSAFSGDGELPEKLARVCRAGPAPPVPLTAAAAEVDSAESLLRLRREARTMREGGRPFDDPAVQMLARQALKRVRTIRDGVGGPTALAAEQPLLLHQRQQLALGPEPPLAEPAAVLAEQAPPPGDDLAAALCTELARLAGDVTGSRDNHEALLLVIDLLAIARRLSDAGAPVRATSWSPSASQAGGCWPVAAC